MARRVPQPHRQFLGVPAAEAALARGGHLTPVVDIILLEHAGGAVVRLAADPDRALAFLGGVAVPQPETPEPRPGGAARGPPAAARGSRSGRSNGWRAAPGERECCRAAARPRASW